MHESIYGPIEQAHEWNSSCLLKLLFEECQLLKRLESLNHYFFMDRGDFISHFIDEREDILEKFTTEVKIEKLESHLDAAIRSSSAQSDPFRDDVTCELNTYGLTEQLIVTCLTRGALGEKAYSTT